MNYDPRLPINEQDVDDDRWSKECDEALDEAVADFMSNCKFDIVAYHKTNRGTDEVELEGGDLMFTTQNILANDPGFKDKVKEYFLKENPEILNDYIASKHDYEEQVKAERAMER